MLVVCAAGDENSGGEVLVEISSTSRSRMRNSMFYPFSLDNLPSLFVYV